MWPLDDDAGNLDLERQDERKRGDGCDQCEGEFEEDWYYDENNYAYLKCSKCGWLYNLEEGARNWAESSFED